jgi:DNA-binding transcriptional LysR family regulator
MYGRVPEILRRFAAERPDVELHLRELPTGAQVEGLQSGTIDVGFIRPPAGFEDVDVEPIDQEAVVAVLPVGHRLARRRRVRLEELGGEAFILLARPEAPGLHDAFMLAMARAGTVPRIVQEVAELQTAIGLVAAGAGITLVPASVAALGRPDVVSVAVAGGPVVELAVAVAHGPRSPIVSAFLESAGARRLP